MNRRAGEAIAWASPLVLLPLLMGAAVDEARNVFAHGYAEVTQKGTPIWVAAVRPGPGQAGGGAVGVQTIVLHRAEFGDTKWNRFQSVPARALGITGHSSELVLLLEGDLRQGGSAASRPWAWFSESTDQPPYIRRFSYGPPLPDNALILAMAGNRRSLYAIGQAASTPATSRPQTRPAARPAGPTLYILGGASWEALPALWPAPFAPGARSSLSLELIANRPHLAVVDSDNSVAVYRLGRDGGEWEPVRTLAGGPDLRRVKLLEIDREPAVWLLGGSVPGSLVINGRTVRLSLPEPHPEPGDMDLTVAGEQLRLIFARGEDFYEQRYRRNGEPDGAPARIVATETGADAPGTWVTMTIMTVLAVFLVISFLRRRPASDEKSDDDSGS